jgi:hypothetical protein
MSAQPRIVTRREWGAATSIPSGRAVAPSTRRYFVVHWPVMNVTDEAAACRSIERIHRNQGWAIGPGYNYLVGMSGAIYEGCGRDVRGIHSPPRNTDGWGVCVLQPATGSGAAIAPISDAAKTSTRALYDWLGVVAGRRLQQWWHGRDFATACPGPQLIAWVQAGMPAATPTPPAQPPPPPTEEVDEMVTSAVAANGSLHVFTVGPGRRTVWYTWQRQGQTTWNGGAQGKGPAGMRRFADAPSGRTIRGVSASVASNGTLHLFVALDDGSTAYSWQRRGATAWNGASQNQIAGLVTLAPAP